MSQQDGVAQVQRSHRGEPSDHRGNTALDTRQSPPLGGLDHDRAHRPAVGDHRRHDHVPRARKRRIEERIAVRIEPLDGQHLVSIPRSTDDPVRVRRGRRDVLGLVGGEGDHLAVGGPDDDAALELEPLDEASQDEPRLLQRVARIVEPPADLDHRLEVRAPLAELALIERGEGRGRDRKQPERGDVEDRHAVEFDGAARRGPRSAGRAWPPGRRGRRRAGASATARS